jgi:hypothetical protein
MTIFGYIVIKFLVCLCLKYAHENGCPLDSDTCRNAAERGQLDCLKYAHENGFKWDEDTCSFAAKNGHLSCLKYTSSRIQAPSYEIKRTLLAQRSPGIFCNTSLLLMAKQYGC